jgi:sugar phosphate permease
MGALMSAFFAGYVLSQIPGGILADKFGARKVMVAGLVWWSVFTALTAKATSMNPMLAIRALFGIGEGVFPNAAVKCVSNWFPRSERGTATAILISSNSIGTAIAPIFAVAIMALWGWRTVFMSLFVPGLIIAVFIWFYIKDNPKDSKMVSAAEMAEYTEPEPVLAGSGPSLSWTSVLKMTSVWQCMLIWFTFDIAMWGFMAWLPTYLVKERGFEMVKMGIYASLPFLVAAIGTILGGMISDKWFAGRRKHPLSISLVLGALFIYLMYSSASSELAMLYQAISGFFLGFAAGAFWSLPLSIIPKEVMGTASGVVNVGGQLAGVVSPVAMGWLIQKTGGSFEAAFIFIVASVILSGVLTQFVSEDVMPEVTKEERTM